MIIDIHGHYYSKNLYPSWVPFGVEPLIEWSKNQDINAIAVSSLDVFSGGMIENKKLSLICANNSKLWQWVTIDPRIPHWWEKLPQDKKVLGLKVHPTWQNYELTDYFRQVLEVAKENNWAVLTHSGVKEHYVDIKKSIIIADKFPEVSVVFAHLGNGFSSYSDVLTQIECLCKTNNENTLIDTSSLAIHLSGLLEESIKRIGNSRILFGTDLPLHFPESMLYRVTKSKISTEDKEKILYKNSISFFPKLKGG